MTFNGIGLIAILMAALLIVLVYDLYRWQVYTLRSKAERERTIRTWHASQWWTA